MAYEKKTKMSLRQAELFIRNGGTYDKFQEKNTALNAGEIKTLWDSATSLRDSRDFIDEVSKKERYATEAFRYGYIGKTVTDQNGNTYVQTNRGSHYGYIAAVYDEKTKRIFAGFTYISEDEKYVHPVIGQAIALKRAIEAREAGDFDIDNTEWSKPYLRNSDELQFNHFKDRARRYFRPEEFSHSRGTKPIEQKQFDEIHVFQYLELAKRAKNKKEFGEIMKNLTESLTKLNKNLK